MVWLPSRRTLLAGIAPIAAATSMRGVPNSRIVEQWDTWEESFSAPTSGNPFVDVQLKAEFRHGNRVTVADGFYDGDGIYRVRFMPGIPGEWSYTIRSTAPELDGKTGMFSCIAATGANHGPVTVGGPQHFRYADGTPHISIGTTCYGWVHQPDELEERTLRTLKNSPFNKIRTCVLPTEQSPHRVPFERDASGAYNHSLFNFSFFQHLDTRIADLRILGIEADLILFHPYDREGFQNMTRVEAHRYLRYVVARYAAYRNVWWSMANEYDLVKTRTVAQWDEFFRILQEADSANHLCSVHYSHYFYDYSKPWITHLSLQSDDFSRTGKWLALYQKPIVFDECKYEGNINKRWGNLSGHEMARRFWLGMSCGAYVGHGETYSGPNGVAWLSKGGRLLGDSVSRIAFLKKIWQEAPPDLQITPDPYYPFVFKPGVYYLYFFDLHQPAKYEFQLPEPESYQVDVIDIWDKAITRIAGTRGGTFTLDLPGKPFQAVRFQRAI